MLEVNEFNNISFDKAIIGLEAKMASLGIRNPQVCLEKTKYSDSSCGSLRFQIDSISSNGKRHLKANPNIVIPFSIDPDDNTYTSGKFYFSSIRYLILSAIVPMNDKWKSSSSSLNLDLYVRLLTGKFKGSIGQVFPNKILLGKSPETNAPIYVSLLAIQNLQLVETDRTELVFQKKTLQIYDSYNNLLEIGESLVYVDRGKLEFATVVGFDTLRKRVIIQNSSGTKDFLKSDRNMMNITKLGPKAMRDLILKNQLEKNT